MFGKIWYNRNGWYVECPPHVMMRLRRLFKQMDLKKGRQLWISDTPENCRELEWFLVRYPMEVKEAELLARRAQEHRDREEYIRGLLDGYSAPRAFELAIPPREYQKVAADIALKTGGLLVADDVGLGKTVTAIAMLSEPSTLPALVVTLTHLPFQWEAEINRFAPHLKTRVVKKGQPYDLTKFRRKDIGHPDVIIMNYHKLYGWAGELAGKVRTVIFDECQELRRGRQSNKGEGAHIIASHADYRIGLSATPFYNYGGEMFPVMDSISPGSLGTRSEFIREWCIEMRDDRQSIKNPKAFGSWLRDQGLMLRRTREDVGRELPSLTKVPHYIDCDQKALDNVKGRATELAKLILDANPQARGVKFKAAEEISYLLRQATGISKAPYVAAFVRMLVESGERVLLYGWHRDVYGVWNDMLEDLDPWMYTGSESPRQKHEAAKAFANGETQLLIMSLRSGAGVEGLQGKCRTVVFGELDWSPGVHEQAIGRIHRDGQEDKVIAYFLLTDSGSDPVIADTLGLKQRQIEGVRDPNLDLIEKLDVQEDNVRRLAKAYLEQR